MKAISAHRKFSHYLTIVDRQRCIPAAGALAIVATFGWTRAQRIRILCSALASVTVLVPYATAVTPPEWTPSFGWWIDWEELDGCALVDFRNQVLAVSGYQSEPAVTPTPPERTPRGWWIDWRSDDETNGYGHVDFRNYLLQARGYWSE